MVQISWPAHISEDAKDLISKILVKDPASRISLLDIDDHPWIVRNCSAILGSTNAPTAVPSSSALPAADHRVARSRNSAASPQQSATAFFRAEKERTNERKNRVQAAKEKPEGDKQKQPGFVACQMIPDNREDCDSDESPTEEEDSNSHPAWTWKSALELALEQQQHVSGDAIFDMQLHKQENIVELSDVFGKTNVESSRAGRAEPSRGFSASSYRYCRRRGSSGDWTFDQLTSLEVDVHNKSMGLLDR